MCGCCLIAANAVGVSSETFGSSSLECNTSILPSSQGRKGATLKRKARGVNRKWMLALLLLLLKKCFINNANGSHSETQATLIFNFFFPSSGWKEEGWRFWAVRVKWYWTNLNANVKNLCVSYITPSLFAMLIEKHYAIRGLNSKPCVLPWNHN